MNNHQIIWGPEVNALRLGIGLEQNYLSTGSVKKALTRRLAVHHKPGPSPELAVRRGAGSASLRAGYHTPTLCHKCVAHKCGTR